MPSRLIGHHIKARLHAEIVEVYYRDDLVLTMPRLHGGRDHCIDYRHVIWSLVKKPGAFARYRYREDLFPSLVFRRAYDALVSRRGDRADVEYVRILLDDGTPFDYATVKALCAPEAPVFPTVDIGAPDLGVYDRLLVGGVA